MKLKKFNKIVAVIAAFTLAVTQIVPASFAAYDPQAFEKDATSVPEKEITKESKKPETSASVRDIHFESYNDSPLSPPSGTESKPTDLDRSIELEKEFSNSNLTELTDRNIIKGGMQAGVDNVVYYKETVTITEDTELDPDNDYYFSEGLVIEEGATLVTADTILIGSIEMSGETTFHSNGDIVINNDANISIENSGFISNFSGIISGIVDEEINLVQFEGLTIETTTTTEQTIDVNEGLAAVQEAIDNAPAGDVTIRVTGQGELTGERLILRDGVSLIVEDANVEIVTFDFSEGGELSVVNGTLLISGDENATQPIEGNTAGVINAFEVGGVTNLIAGESVRLPIQEINSERTNIITGYYNNILNRDPDTNGLNYWVNSDLSLEEIEKAFYESKEHRTNVVTGYYNNILDRDPDTNGLNYWVNSDLSLEEIEEAFYESEEYKNS